MVLFVSFVVEKIMTEYFYPQSLEEAVGILEAHDGTARVMAGGTDLLLDMRKGRFAPRCLVDVTRIPGLEQITLRSDAAGEWVEVGAAVTFAALSASPLVDERVPALAEAARAVGAAAIQTTATWVGNIVQAMPAADGGIAAMALHAEACVVSRDGATWQPVETLFAGPGVSTVDSSREIVSHLRFPLPAGAWGCAWRRVGRREALVLPVLNCAVRLCLAATGAAIDEATIVLGPVGPRPLRARAAESYLRGQYLAEDVLVQASCLARDDSQPRDSVTRASREYRLAIIPAIVRDALRIALERAGW